ncbi:Mut7-C RNAse domain-containing protein [Vulcanisaeta thermophila]|uniref:Mut7-C RNAse domain-containing protein n=1 Tax=Vulcanisaeta thermophila TaxID=867917 RepID=UPI000A5AFB28|nr:Mut7-C RNAse domain-containing protein [Vulcanisaeta thermophila]
MSDLDIAMLNRCVELPLRYGTVYVDSMLGWLVRWLRMLGVSVNYTPSFSDDYLAGVNGLLITRDRNLFRLRRGESLLLLTMNHEHWLATAILVLGVEPSINGERSLCPMCGSKLVRVGKDVIKNLVPPRVLSTHDEFWLCTGCGRVYWVGSHHGRINAMLSRARELVGKLTVKCVGNTLIIQAGDGDPN